MKGRKTAGRQAGTRNQRSVERERGVQANQLLDIRPVAVDQLSPQ
jgi:hypothetical protein